MSDFHHSPVGPEPRYGTDTSSKRSWTSTQALSTRVTCATLCKRWEDRSPRLSNFLHSILELVDSPLEPQPLLVVWSVPMALEGQMQVLSIEVCGYIDSGRPRSPFLAVKPQGSDERGLKDRKSTR